jgi:hypothetical protein
VLREHSIIQEKKHETYIIPSVTENAFTISLITEDNGRLGCDVM